MDYRFNSSNHIINLIDYVPDILKDVLEISEIMGVETREFKRARKGYEDVFADQYISEATENGIGRWEKLLNIPTRVSEEVDDRRFRILAKLNQSLPYTEVTLKRMLKNLTGGWDEFSVSVDGLRFVLKVRVALTSKSKFRDVDELLKNLVPANLIIDLALKYNQHLTVGKFTHEQLRCFTHKDLNDTYLFGGENGNKNKRISVD